MLSLGRGGLPCTRLLRYLVGFSFACDLSSHLIRLSPVAVDWTCIEHEIGSSSPSDHKHGTLMFAHARTLRKLAVLHWTTIVTLTECPSGGKVVTAVICHFDALPASDYVSLAASSGTFLLAVTCP